MAINKKNAEKSPSKLDQRLQKFFNPEIPDIEPSFGGNFDDELRSVSSNFYKLSGYDFLNYVCKLCAKLLETDFVYVAELNKEGTKVIIKAENSDKIVLDGSEIEIEHKPLKPILSKQFICYPKNVSKEFPDDLELKKLNIHSFAGLPLLNNSDDIIGMLYIYNTKTITNIETIESTLRLFSGRISAELNLIKKEEQLIKSEKKYQTLFETADDAINIIKGVEYVDCNSKTLKTFGCKNKNEFIGKTVLDFSPEKQPDGSFSKEKAWHLINETLKGVPQRFYWKHCRKDKTEFDTEVSLNPLQIEGATHFQAVVRDITQQKHSSELKQKLSTAVEQSSSSILITNISGEIEYVNPKFTETTGYTIKEVIGRKPNILKSGHTTKEEYKELWNTILAGKVWKGEFKNIKKNRKFYWESASIAPITNELGNITHFVAIQDDITESKKVELLLKQSEERYLSIFENLHDVLYITDLKGTILELSPSIKFHFGYDRDKLLGTSVYDVYYDSTEREKFLNIIQQNGIVSDYEIVLKNEYGEKVYCSANARLVFDENGNPKQVEGIMRNITERKLNEEKLRLSEERLRQAQEIAHIGTFEFDVKNGIYWGSDEAKRILGYDLSTETISLEQLRESYVDREKTISLHEDAMKNLDSYNIEFDIYRFNKYEKRTLNSIAEIKRDKDGNPEKILGLIQDITERKQIEKELVAAKERAEKSEQQLKLIADNFVNGMIYQVAMLDEERRHFNYVSEAVNKLYGCTVEEAMENPDLIYSKLHPEDINELLEKEKEALKNMSIFKAESRVINPDGTIRWSYYISKPRVINDIVCWDGIEIDITERKQLELDLIKTKNEVEKSENFYKSLNQNLPLGAHYYNLNENNQLIFNGANPAADEILGIDHAQFIGKTIEEAFPDLIQTEVPEKYREAAFNGITWSTEQITYNDGEIVGVFEVVAYQTIPGSMVAIFSDVTSRKLAESELIKAKEKAEESEDRFKTLSSIAEEGLMIHEDGIILDANHAFAKISGFDDPDVLIGKNAFEVIPLTKESMKVVKEHSINKSEETYDITLINKDGIYIQAQTSAAEIAYKGRNARLVRMEDITDRKKVELELLREKEKAEESEIRFKSISENANDGITLADKDGRYVFANKAFSELTKYSVTEILQKKVIDIAIPDKNKPYQFNKIETNQEYSIRRNLLCKDNSIIIADIHGKIIEISGEKLALGIVRDVTDIVKWENELINAKEKAEESDKLKTAFLLNVSHEIRTPMNGILGFLNLLKQPELSDDQKSDFIEIVNKSGERLMNTINDIVEISRIQTGDIYLNIQEIDITEIMQYNLDFFKVQTEYKGLELIIKEQVVGDGAVIETDKQKLDDILMNLIKNAIKFTNKGKIEIGNYIENDELIFYVSDTGCGIPNNKLEAIFERFVQADVGLNRNYEGSGIGLSIVKAHIESLSGKINVKSEVGKGSTFKFSIPYNPVKKIPTQKPSEETPQLPLNKITILITEDDEVNYYLIENMLSGDYKLIHAYNGESTIQLLKENPDVALILMDIKIPGEFDGLETTRRIRKFNKKIPIIAQTAFAQSADKLAAIDAGCNDYISKPFTTSQLKSIISKYYE